MGRHRLLLLSPFPFPLPPPFPRRSSSLHRPLLRTLSSSSSSPVLPLSKSEVFQFLQLKSFDDQEISSALRRLSSLSSPAPPSSTPPPPITANPSITAAGVELYIKHDLRAYRVGCGDDVHTALRFVRTFSKPSGSDDGAGEEGSEAAASKAPPLSNLPVSLPLPLPLPLPLQPLSLSPSSVQSSVRSMATLPDAASLLPLSVSMLLVGSCVGMITPIMPYIKESLELSAGDFGYVVSAFGLAKLLGNIPSTILVERHGRKPYLVYSLLAVGAGTLGLGYSSSFSDLVLCRLSIGFGVAALSTAATLTVSDLSTPLNRSSTMAPVMAAFAAGTALGPALGGQLADALGVQATFAMVGTAFAANAALNANMIRETGPGGRKELLVPKSGGENDAVVDDDDDDGRRRRRRQEQRVGMAQSVRDAVGLWRPLLEKPGVRRAVAINSCYWIALSGAQMTLLPLLLTDAHGFALTASSLGQAYAGMSFVQVLGGQPAALVADRLGRLPVLVCGNALVAASIVAASQSGTLEACYAALGCWALGQSFLSTTPIAHISDLVDERSRAQAIALLRTGGDAGFLAGAVGFGALATVADVPNAMGAAGGFLMAATTWFGARSFAAKDGGEEGGDGGKGSSGGSSTSGADVKAKQKL